MMDDFRKTQSSSSDFPSSYASTHNRGMFWDNLMFGEYPSRLESGSRYSLSEAVSDTPNPRSAGYSGRGFNKARLGTCIDPSQPRERFQNDSLTNLRVHDGHPSVEFLERNVRSRDVVDRDVGIRHAPPAVTDLGRLREFDSDGDVGIRAAPRDRIDFERSFDVASDRGQGNRFVPRDVTNLESFCEFSRNRDEDIGQAARASELEMFLGYDSDSQPKQREEVNLSQLARELNSSGNREEVTISKLAEELYNSGNREELSISKLAEELYNSDNMEKLKLSKLAKELGGSGRTLNPSAGNYRSREKGEHKNPFAVQQKHEKGLFDYVTEIDERIEGDHDWSINKSDLRQQLGVSESHRGRERLESARRTSSYAWDSTSHEGSSGMLGNRVLSQRSSNSRTESDLIKAPHTESSGFRGESSSSRDVQFLEEIVKLKMSSRNNEAMETQRYSRDPEGPSSAGTRSPTWKVLADELSKDISDHFSVKDRILLDSLADQNWSGSRGDTRDESDPPHGSLEGFWETVRHKLDEDKRKYSDGDSLQMSDIHLADVQVGRAHRKRDSNPSSRLPNRETREMAVNMATQLLSRYGNSPNSSRSRSFSRSRSNSPLRSNYHPLARLGGISPRRLGSRSPQRMRSRSPRRLRSRSPRRLRSRSPRRLRSRSPKRLSRRSPRRLRSRSPRRLRSRSPGRFRRRSPGRFRSRSPGVFRSSPPGGFRSGSPRGMRKESLGVFRSSPPRESLGVFRSSPPREFRSEDYRSRSPWRIQSKSPEQHRAISPHGSINAPLYGFHGTPRSPLPGPSVESHSVQKTPLTAGSPYQLIGALKLVNAAIKKAGTSTSYQIKVTWGDDTDVSGIRADEKRRMLLSGFEVRLNMVHNGPPNRKNMFDKLIHLENFAIRNNLNHDVCVAAMAHDDEMDIRDAKPYELAEYFRDSDVVIVFKTEGDLGDKTLLSHRLGRVPVMRRSVHERLGEKII